MPTIAANGLQTAYEVHGAGPPLVMLHGATTSGSVQFADLAPALAGGFRIYLPDARGHAGTADAPDGAFTASGLVDDLLAFVDGLELSTVPSPRLLDGWHDGAPFRHARFPTGSARSRR